LLSGEARELLIDALDALQQWRDEIIAANDLCLTKALSRMAAAQRAMGSPDHVSSAARESILTASKLQTDAIEKVVEVWQQLLTTGRLPATVPQGVEVALSGISERRLAESVPDPMHLAEMSLAPFRACMQVADIWQRHWVTTVAGWQDHSSSTTNTYKKL
jgi:hypothetical protein